MGQRRTLELDVFRVRETGAAGHLRPAYIAHRPGCGSRGVKLSPLAARILGGYAPYVSALCGGACVSLCGCRVCCPPRRHRGAVPPGPHRPGLPADTAMPAPAAPPDVGGDTAAQAVIQLPPAPPQSEADGAELPAHRATAACHGAAVILTESRDAMQPSDTPLPPQTGDAPPVPRDDTGLLSYKKWWFLRHVDVSVAGTLLSGTPIFAEHGAMRLVDAAHSYFIPLNRIDYIRTDDGLNDGAPADKAPGP